MNRRQVLRALGLGALVAPRFALSQTVTAPRRIVFFVTPHGHVPASWKLAIPNGSTTTVAERSLPPLQQSELPEVLGMSDRIMVMHEGHVSGFLDRAEADQVRIMELAAK